MLEIRLYQVMDHMVGSVQYVPLRAEDDHSVPEKPISLAYRAYPVLTEDDGRIVGRVVKDLLARAERRAGESGGYSLLI